MPPIRAAELGRTFTACKPVFNDCLVLGPASWPTKCCPLGKLDSAAELRRLGLELRVHRRRPAGWRRLRQVAIFGGRQPAPAIERRIGETVGWK